MKYLKQYLVLLISSSIHFYFVKILCEKYMFVRMYLKYMCIIVRTYVCLSLELNWFERKQTEKTTSRKKNKYVVSFQISF